MIIAITVIITSCHVISYHITVGTRRRLRFAGRGGWLRGLRSAGGLHISLSLYIYIYIIERERERERQMCIYVYVYTYTYIHYTYT